MTSTTMPFKVASHSLSVIVVKCQQSPQVFEHLHMVQLNPVGMKGLLQGSGGFCGGIVLDGCCLPFPAMLCLLVDGCWKSTQQIYPLRSCAYLSYARYEYQSDTEGRLPMDRSQMPYNPQPTNDTMWDWLGLIGLVVPIPGSNI